MKCIFLNKCYRIQKGHSRMDNPEKLATRKTKKKNKNEKNPTTQYVLDTTIINKHK